MEKGPGYRLVITALIFLGGWLAVRFLLPVLLPFLLGLMFAVLAEPGVRFLHERLRLPRAAASALAVSAGFVMLFVVVWLLGAVAYRELTELAGGLPAFFTSVADTTARFRDFCLELSARAPEGLSQGLNRWVTDLFANSSVLLEQAASRVLGMVGSVMGWIPGSALMVGTAVISSFMISAQLPALKKRIRLKVPKAWLQKFEHGFDKARFALGGWLKAQLKLSGLTLMIVAVGLAMLRVSGWILWAVLIALVDAVPILGTGTVLIPWCLWSFIQGDSIRAVGLLGVYVTAMMTRSALEPKLVGRQLGMNPLLTLVALYAGYRIWGVPGMILAPILTVMAKQLATLRD